METDFFDGDDFDLIDEAYQEFNNKKAELKDQAKVLVLDDETGNLEVLEGVLNHSFKLKTFLNAEEAIKALEEEDFHVILSDQRMPMMLGTEFLVKAKKIRPEAVRMILTGYSDVEDIISSINSGEVFRYILKPWNKDELLTTVKQAAEKSQLERENKKLLYELKKVNLELAEKVAEQTKDLRVLISQILPDELIDKALYQEYGFKLLNISLMFIDLVGSTAYHEDIKNREIIGKKFQELQTMLFHCIQENHLGHYVSETGDGCFSIFGTPFKTQTHQIDAVLAGLQVLFRYKWNQLNSKDPHPGKGLRISIHSGEVVVGHTGPKQKIGYNALGPAINIAARIEPLAPTNSVLITEVVKDNINHIFKIKEHGKFKLKGIEEDQNLYIVEGIKTVLDNDKRVLEKSRIHNFIGENLGGNFEERIFDIQKNMFPGVDFLKNESLDGGILHARAVAIFSSALAKKVGILEDKIDFNLIYAAMLHDAGKVFIPRSILLKRFGEMPDEEKDLFKKMSLSTLAILRNHGFSKQVCYMVKRFYFCKNQERENPSFELEEKELTGDEYYDNLVECIILADYYDALTNRKLFYQDEGMGPREALKFMKENLEYKYLNDFVDLLSE